ncbi:hypothetical protein [Sneathiella sp.]|uniref:hypothetical protein n=1 Tax=Sneathiella sp. TaxID=1964365 RepID=UPI00356705BE
MKYIPKIDINKRERFENAWETFADLIVPGSNHRGKLLQLRVGKRDETREETEKRIWLLDKTEHGLKQQFLSYIPDGFFRVYGCEISAVDNENKKTQISCELFNTRLSGFQPFWGEDRIEVLGKTYIGLEFEANIDVIQAEWPSHDFRQELGDRPGDRSSRSAPDDVRKESPSSMEGESRLPTNVAETNRTGRPSKGDMISSAISHFATAKTNWWTAIPKEDRRKQYYARIKEAHDLDPTRSDGFSVKTIEKYETKYRKETKI